MEPEKDFAEPELPATDADVDVRGAALDDVAGEVADAAALDEQALDEHAELHAQVNDAQKRVLMAQAELDNFRKRSRRDMEEERRYANLSLMRDLLPVVDNFERAIAAEDASDSPEGLLAGVHMVAQQLRSVLEQHDCRLVKAQDELFDPNIHQAVMQQPSKEHSKGRVISVVQSGYRLHDRVIRPAQVIVSTGEPE